MLILRAEQKEIQEVAEVVSLAVPLEPTLVEVLAQADCSSSPGARSRVAVLIPVGEVNDRQARAAVSALRLTSAKRTRSST